ncbi:MAG TPA: V-type ATP synthase subunit E family protein [Solirubrobacteraceae bacterium]|nr:V-type ATP synthase subunit E family protein [Solirubrobacteraceae bacterium]
MTAPAGPLLEQLRRDADAAIAARHADARAEAERVTAGADAERARRRATLLGEREHALAMRREAELAAVTQATVRGVLDARDAFLDRAFAAAEARLAALARAPDLAGRLRSPLAEALPFVDPAELRVRCAPALRPAVADALAAAGAPGAPIMEDELVPVGAMLEDAAGRLRVDATFAARLHRLRPELAIEAVRLVEAADA